LHMASEPRNSQHPTSSGGNSGITESNVHPASSFTSVADAGVSFDQNWKFRKRMEDAHCIVDKYNGVDNQGFFAVYDGHGGKEAANFCSQHLHQIFGELLTQATTDVLKDAHKVQELLKTAYFATDTKMKDTVPNHHGCTTVTCFVAGSLKDSSRQLFAANCGDARAVLCRNGKAIRLTEDHKATCELEAKRITDSGGFIINGRVNGQIVITRSLGDHLMKEFIIADPFMTHHILTENDSFLIVACDGLWDVVEDQAACDLVLEYQSATAAELSKRLLIKALKDGSTDNLSIIVVKL